MSLKHKRASIGNELLQNTKNINKLFVYGQIKQRTVENELGQVVPVTRINNRTGSEHTQDLKLEIPDRWDGAAECQNMPKSTTASTCTLQCFANILIRLTVPMDPRKHVNQARIISAGTGAGWGKGGAHGYKVTGVISAEWGGAGEPKGSNY